MQHLTVLQLFQAADGCARPWKQVTAIVRIFFYHDPAPADLTVDPRTVNADQIRHLLGGIPWWPMTTPQSAQSQVDLMAAPKLEDDLGREALPSAREKLFPVQLFRNPHVILARVCQFADTDDD